jgi:citrate lyase alpha subunit
VSNAAAQASAEAPKDAIAAGASEPEPKPKPENFTDTRVKYVDYKGGSNQGVIDVVRASILRDTNDISLSDLED